jgi:hypothetical protein
MVVKGKLGLVRCEGKTLFNRLVGLVGHDSQPVSYQGYVMYDSRRKSRWVILNDFTSLYLIKSKV